MRERISLPNREVTPSLAEVLGAQGMPSSVDPGKRVVDLTRQAVSTYEQLCDATGLLQETTVETFAGVYYGEGHNEEPTPLGEVFAKADYLALFAVTLGQRLSDHINDLFTQNEYAMGVALDAAASEGAELAARAVQSRLCHFLTDERRRPPNAAVLVFSPGYCGWHLTAQRKLFEHLHPEEIGVRLNESCLMIPLKSISGVLVCAQSQLFDFDPGYPPCLECTTRSCRDRVKTVT